MASYTYTLGVDTAATQWNPSQFQQIVQGSAISSATIQYSSSLGTTVIVYFNTTLSVGDKTILDGLVSAYVYSAPSVPVYVDTTSSQLITNKQLDTSNTIVDATVNSKVLQFSLSGLTSSTTSIIALANTSARTFTIPEPGTNSSFLLTDSGSVQTIATGNLAISSTSASTSSTTGALQVAGGAYFGANSLMAANLTLNGTSAVLALSGASSALTLANTTASTSSITGALQVAGGAYFGANSLMAANLTLNGTSAVLALSGASSALTLANTTASTSSTTGALRVAGGAYFGANSLYNANLTLQGASAVLALSGASSTLTLANTTASTSSTTGALQVAGGAYFGTNSLMAANLTLNGTSAVLALSGASSTLTLANTTASTSSTTGALQVAGGAYFGANSIYNANLALTGVAGVLTIANTTASTSSTTGALQVAGGAYFGTNSLMAANLTLNGTSAVLALSGASSTLTLANTTASTSSTTGALQVAGGAYFGANSLYNANLTLQGASAVLALSGATSALTLANTAASTSSTTGALRVAGGAYFGTDSLMAANLTLNGTSAVLALSGTSSTLTLANTTLSTSSTTGALQVAGGLFTRNIWLGGVSYATSAVSTSGILFNVPATTITANNTSDMAFLSIQQPTLANSVALSTTTNASTFYIANAPTAGTNQTITNSYALRVNAGKSYFGGTVQIPTGASNGFVLTSDGSGNASWTNPSTSMNLTFFSAFTASVFTTSSLTLTPILSFSLTPNVAGTYWVNFNAAFRNSNSNRTARFVIALNGTAQTADETYIQTNQANDFTVAIGQTLSLNGTTDAITVLVSISGNSITVNYRTLTALRVSA